MDRPAHPLTQTDSAPKDQALSSLAPEDPALAEPRADVLDLRRLATPPDAIRWDLGERSGAPRSEGRLCVVRIGDRPWGLDGRFAVGIQHIENPTPIPLTPAYLIGLAHVRGALMPVIDVGSFLSPTARRRPAGDVPAFDALVVDVDEVRLCFVVDEVLSFEPTPEAVESSFDAPPSVPENWCRGAVSLDEHGQVPMLDLPRMVDSLRLRPEPRGEGPGASVP